MAIGAWLMAIGASFTATLGGWLVASLAAVLAVRARRSLALRTDSVARACHELRGPITAARLGLQLGTRSGELSAVRLQAIDAELGRAALALDDLAGAQTLARGVARPALAPRPYAVVPLDPREVVAGSVEAWSAIAFSRGGSVAMRWSGPRVWVLGDRLRLAQATGNLIANAIEHGGGSVEVCGHGDGSIVRIEVSDGGPGLPAPVADLARSRRRRLRTGRGHGLSIALAVAEAHGGRLAAAPAEHGARLVLELPTAAGASAG